MIRVRSGVAAATLATVLFGASTSRAQQVAPAPAPAPQNVQQVIDQVTQLRLEFDLIRRQYDERLLALEQRLRQLGAGPLTIEPAAAAVAPASAAPVGTPQAAGSTPAADTPVAQAGDQTSTPMPAGGGRVFNPDTSVIGNFVGAAGKNPFSQQPAMQLSEAEVAFQAVVDPYAKADFFLAAGPEGLDVEEGYLTFTALPHNLLVKVGKMRAQFGKVNTLHTHAMPTVDRPLVIQNLVGGEDGLSDSGLSVSKLIDNKLLFLEATGEVYAGDNPVFQSPDRSHLTYVARLRGYRDLTEDKNLDFGVSYAFGPTAPPTIPGVAASLNKTLFGVDVTYRYRPLRRAIYSRINLRSELIWSRQDLPTTGQRTAFGYYGLGEWQFAQRWFAGARIDRSAQPFEGDVSDTGGSFFVTFWPSEFTQIRSQYRRTNYGGTGISANEMLFQLNFAIGAHGAHAF